MTSSDSVTVVASRQVALELARHLQSRTRGRPTVVVTVPAARTEPYIDPQEIASEVAGLADVYLVPTGVESWALTDGLPAMTDVYGGAGRVYPVGLEWVHNPYVSPLRFAFNSAEGRSSTVRLVADALRMANLAGLLARPPTTGSQRVSGRVKGIVAGTGRAVVRLDSGSMASVQKEFTFPEVPLRRVLRPGMTVTGMLDAESRRLDIRASARSVADCLTPYAVGAVVLAQVDSVDERTATLLLHPDLPVQIRADAVTSNPADVLTSLMSPREILAARIVQRGEVWELSLIDIDDDEEPAEAPCLFEGGPPWLDLADVPEVPQAPPEFVPPHVSHAELPSEPESQREQPGAEADIPEPPLQPSPRLLDRLRPQRPAGGRPPKPPAAAETAQRARAAGPATRQLSLDLDAARGALSTVRGRNDELEKAFTALRTEHQLMARRLNELAGDLHSARTTIENQRTELRKSKQRQAKSVRPVTKRVTNDVVFLGVEDQFRFEVTNAWAHRIAAAEKSERPLRDYALGEDFLVSVDTAEGVERSKVVDVVVEVLTGIAAELNGRDLHRLRTSVGADSPPVVRGDGAMCWRAALQVNTASARRLHYWQLRDGSIELSRVVLHDDMTP